MGAFWETAAPAMLRRRGKNGLVLKGCIDLYRAGSEAIERDALLSAIHAGAAEPGETLALIPETAEWGKALFFAWDETGDALYRQAAERIMAQMKAEALPLTPETLYALEPFRAEFDTRFGDKQTYKFIAAQFKQAREALLDPDKKLYREPESGRPSLLAQGLMLMALVDTIEKIDMQLYEHYRALADLFLEAVRNLLPYQRRSTCLFALAPAETAEEAGFTENAMIAYAIMKGVGQGLLDPEKYLPAARRALSALDAIAESPAAELTDQEASLYLMAQAENKGV